MNTSRANPLLPRGNDPLRSILIGALSLAVMLLVAAVLPRPDRGRASIQYSLHLLSVKDGRARFRVELQLPRPRGRELRLRGFASTAALHLEEVAARTGRHSLRLLDVSEHEVVTGVAATIPGWRIEGPFDRPITVTYVATIGMRDGDEHVGYNGQCFGLARVDFLAMSGRSLFLGPEDPTEWHAICVRVSLPPHWQVETPWTREGQTFRVGLPDSDPIEHLVTASLAMGVFAVRDTLHHGTHWRFVEPACVPQAQVQAVERELIATTSLLAQTFGHGLGRTYTTIVCPKSAAGDEPKGEGWAAGQGRALIPLTHLRLRDFAESVVDAYVLHAPYRSSFSDRRDFWLPSALRSYLALKTIARVRQQDDVASASAFAVRLMMAPGQENHRLSLESDYASPNVEAPGGEAAGSCLLYYLDRQLAQRTSGHRSLDDVVARMFQGRRARSLWDVLSSVAPGDWRSDRERYAREGKFPRLADFPALQAARPVPEPPAGPGVRRLRLIVTGNSEGFLENCGCKANQAGGVARRASFLRRQRADGVPTLVLDAGNAMPRPGRFDPQDPFAREEAALALERLREDGYAAVAVSTFEQTWGLRFLTDLRDRSRAPFISSLRDSAGTPLAPTSRTVTVDGMRVGLVAVFEPPIYQDAQGSYENHAGEFSRPEPLAELARVVAAIRPQVDLVFVLGRATPAFAREIVRRVRGVDAILSNEPFALVVDEQGHSHETDEQGFIGRTLILYTTEHQYGLTLADLQLDRDHRITVAAFSHESLDDSVPDDAAVRASLDRFYRVAGAAYGSGARVERPFASDSLREHGRYAGVAVCRPCHVAEHAQWLETKHASAFHTLLDAHRNYQPRCVACHVVAFGGPHGYALGAHTNDLAGVQCEVCHGPGAEHAAAPTRVHLQRGDDEQMCCACHTPDHSEAFDYAQRLQRVIHLPLGATRHSPTPVAAPSRAGSRAGG